MIQRVPLPELLSHFWLASVDTGAIREGEDYIARLIVSPKNGAGLHYHLIDAENNDVPQRAHEMTAVLMDVLHDFWDEFEDLWLSSIHIDFEGKAELNTIPVDQIHDYCEQYRTWKCPYRS